MRRTPYGVEDSAGAFARAYKSLADEGYIFVVPGHSRQVRIRRQLRHAAARPCAGGHQEPRRGYRYLRHHRVAAPERAQSQRPRRHARRLLRRLDDDHGRDRAAPGAEGDFSAGLASRHVAGRRLPSQRRVALELRLRIRRDDGERQGRPAVPVRSLRHVRLVSGSRPAGQREPAVPAREDSHLERLRRPSRLRRVLETPDDGAAPAEREGADAERGRLVGPGGLLRPAGHLRGAREARLRRHELPGRRALEPRRMDPHG